MKSYEKIQYAEYFKWFQPIPILVLALLMIGAVLTILSSLHICTEACLAGLTTDCTECL